MNWIDWICSVVFFSSFFNVHKLNMHVKPFSVSLSLSLSLLHNRLCVSASQDGKLIVWDSISTNKVREMVYHNYCAGR